ncbi:MAG: hypothetical protein WD648_06755, partial [Planctomycetaceae bacterium]
MQFHEYVTFRNQMAKFGHNDEARKTVKGMTAQDYRSFFLKCIPKEMQRAGPGQESHQLMDRYVALSAEQTWVDADRPFYNVWPIATNLAREVKLTIPFSAVEIPFDSILLRFARGHELHEVVTAMLFWPKDWPHTPPTINVLCYFSGTMWGASGFLDSPVSYFRGA